MTFRSYNGREIKLRSATKYLIKWDGPCKSKFQLQAKSLLHPFWFADVVFEEFPVVGTRLTLDFYNANKRIALEVDGNQHYKYSKFFHGEEASQALGFHFRAAYARELGIGELGLECLDEVGSEQVAGCLACDHGNQ